MGNVMFLFLAVVFLYTLCLKNRIPLQTNLTDVA